MAANYVLDQKGRLLTTVFPAYRGDASIGAQEVIEVSVDLSIIGSATTVNSATLGIQSLLPNANAGLGAGDSIDIAVLPSNFQVQSVQFQWDLNAPTPDAVPVGNLTGLTGIGISLGRTVVGNSDRSTVQTVSGFTPSATTYMSAVASYTGSAFAAPSLVYTTGTDFLPYNTPGVNASAVTLPAAPNTAGVYVLRMTISSLTGGASTGIKSGKFRFRIGGIAYNT